MIAVAMLIAKKGPGCDPTSRFGLAMIVGAFAALVLDYQLGFCLRARPALAASGWGSASLRCPARGPKTRSLRPPSAMICPWGATCVRLRRGQQGPEGLGGKGANLAEMTRLGLPVPPGSPSPRTPVGHLVDGREPEGLADEVDRHLAHRDDGPRRRGGPDDPLPCPSSAAACPG